MTNLKELIGDVSLGLKKFSKKVYGKFNPELKVNDEEKRFYTGKENAIARLVTFAYIVIKYYNPVSNIEDLHL